MIDSERLRDRLKLSGLSQSELARRVGVTQATVFKLIRGETYGTTKLHRIARELGTTPAYLTGETDDPQADAPPEPELTHDEAQMVEKWRLLSPEDRRALDRILDRMISPGTVHAPLAAFRAEGDA